MSAFVRDTTLAIASSLTFVSFSMCIRRASAMKFSNSAAAHRRISVGDSKSLSTSRQICSISNLAEDVVIV